MREEHEKFILENISKKSIKEIARYLRVKERKIKKFLDKEKRKKKVSGSFFDFKKTFLSILLIAIVGFTVYSNSLQGGFVWDDTDLVKDNIYITSFSYIAEIFGNDIGAGAQSEFKFYRPLQILTYALDYKFWKLDVFGYHLVNTILHILVAICLYLLIYNLFGQTLLSLLTSILFVAHPIHTDAVSYISGRADSLAALFMILSFIFYLRTLSAKRISFYILTGLAYGLALLSKEFSLIFIGLLLLYHYCFRKRIDFKIFLIPLAMACVYILARFTILNSFVRSQEIKAPLFERLAGFFAAILSYLRLLVLPFDLHMEYGLRIFSWLDPRVIAGILLCICLLIFAYKKRKNEIFSFSIGWFFIALIPYSGVYPINAYMAEHWLYLPSVGFFLIVANFFIRLQRFQRISLAFFIILIGSYSFLTLKQNNYWRLPVAFYKRTLKYAPNSPRVHNNLGLEYINLKEIDQAILSFRKALEFNPDHSYVYYNLGNALRLMGEDTKAIEAFLRAVEIKPDYSKAYYNLGNAYSDVGETEKAIEAYKTAIKINPGYTEAYNNLGNAYRNMGRNEEGVAAFKKVIELNPRDIFAYNNLANAYSDMGRNLEAVEIFNKALVFSPGHPDIYFNLGHVYRAMGDFDKAIASFKKAIRLNPRHAMAYYSLAVAYHQKGQYDLAIKNCDKAIESGYKASPEFLEALRPYRTNYR